MHTSHHSRLVTVRLLAGVVLVVAAPRRQLGRLAVGPLQPLAVAAVGGGGGAQGVRHLPRPHLARHHRHRLVLGPPRRGRHGAGLRGEVDRRGLVRPVHLVRPLPRPLPRPLLGPGVLLVARLALLAQGEQLLDSLGTGGACKAVAECDYCLLCPGMVISIFLSSMQLSRGLATHRTCWAPGRGSCRSAACLPRARGRSSARGWSWSCSPRSGSGSGSASAPAQDSVTS